MLKDAGKVAEDDSYSKTDKKVMNVEQPPLDASVVSSNQGLMRELQGLDGYEENFKLKNEKL